MKVGDRVRLKKGSQYAELLGRASDAVGVVGDLDSTSIAFAINVHYPELGLYTSPLPAGEFVILPPEDQQTEP